MNLVRHVAGGGGGTSSSVLLNVSYHEKHEYIIYMVKNDFKNWLSLDMPPGQPLSLGLQISNYLAKTICQYHITKIRKICSVVSEKQTRSDKILAVLGTPNGQL